MKKCPEGRPERGVYAPNDVAPLTIAGHPFSVDGVEGGLASLRISLRSAALVDLARALARLEGVRVTAGPTIVCRGDCYLVHCAAFKLVLSSPAPRGDFAQGLLSRTIGPKPALAITCELETVFARLLAAPVARTESPPNRARETRSSASTLRRTMLQPGKPLTRKTQLGRKTPLLRGRRGP
jgi:hypothetical protein